MSDYRRRIESIRSSQLDYNSIDASVKTMSLKSLHRFLDNGLKGENPENWILDFLNGQAADRSNGGGVESGRIYLDNPCTFKEGFTINELVDEGEKRPSRIVQNYENDKAENEPSIGECYSTSELMSIMRTLTRVAEDEIITTETGSRNSYRALSEIGFTEIRDRIEEAIQVQDNPVTE